MFSKAKSKCLLILMICVFSVGCSSNRMGVRNLPMYDENDLTATDQYTLNPIIGALVGVAVEQIVKSIDPKNSKLLGLKDSSNTESYESDPEDESSSESGDGGSFESEDDGFSESEDAGSFESEDDGFSEPESEYNYKATRPGFCFVTTSPNVGNHWEGARAGRGDMCADPQPIVSETRPVTRPIVRDHRRNTRTPPRARVVDHRKSTRS